jgi:hypothetical protein
LALTFVGLALYCTILLQTTGELATFDVFLLFFGAVMYGIANSCMWFSFSIFMGLPLSIFVLFHLIFPISLGRYTTSSNRGKLSGLFFSIFYINSPVGNFLGAIFFAIGLPKVFFFNIGRGYLYIRICFCVCLPNI